MMQELNYIRCGDFYIPDIRLPEENRPIGRWGRMHRDYIKEHNLIRFNDLCLSGELWTYLADGVNTDEFNGYYDNTEIFNKMAEMLNVQ